MDIEIERRADVGVAQYDAHGLVVAVARTNFASEKIVHERQAARAMMTFCFINAASRYHDSPVKQRDVHKDSKGGIARHGRFPPLPMKKPRNTLCFRGSIILWILLSVINDVAVVAE